MIFYHDRSYLISGIKLHIISGDVGRNNPLSVNIQRLRLSSMAEARPKVRHRQAGNYFDILLMWVGSAWNRGLSLMLVSHQPVCHWHRQRKSGEKDAAFEQLFVTHLLFAEKLPINFTRTARDWVYQSTESSWWVSRNLNLNLHRSTRGAIIGLHSQSNKTKPTETLVDDEGAECARGKERKNVNAPDVNRK